MPSLDRKAIGEAFEQLALPTGFYTAMYRTPESNIFSTKTIFFDIKRDGEEYAVDVIRGTGGRGNINKRFTTKEYEPPSYNEFGWVNQSERLLRVIGRTEYSEHTEGDILTAIVQDLLVFQKKLDRSVEKQAVDALFLGTITLVNGDTVDFKQKSTHQTTSGALGNSVWTNAAGDPDDDLQQLCDLNRKDGKSTSNVAEFGTQALKRYLENAKIIAKTNFRRVDNINLRPPRLNSEGAVFHGFISVGDYELEVWTYPQFYTVPTGFGLANEGTSQPYIPVDKVRVGNKDSRFDLVYAGVEKLVPVETPELSALGINQVPRTMRGKTHIYGAVDTLQENAKFGVKSAPLAIPTDIDSFAILTTA